MEQLPSWYPPPGPLGRTNPFNWRLYVDDQGVQKWYYLDNSGETKTPNKLTFNGPEREQQFVDELYLNLPLNKPTLKDPSGNPLEAARNGYKYIKEIQSSCGTFPVGFDGFTFFTPAFVIAMYVTNTPIPREWKIELSRYFYNVQNDGGPENSGWGLDDEGTLSCAMNSCLNYTAQRLLGVDADHPSMVKARATIHHLGGAVRCPIWGKFWLAILNVYDWEGTNPWPPEVPTHPGRWWLYPRIPYMLMCFLGGIRFRATEDPLIRSLRQELYVEPYETIDWPKHRNNVSPTDLHRPHSLFADTALWAVGHATKIIPSFVRKYALNHVYNLIVMEDENTDYQCLQPLFKCMVYLSRYYVEGPECEAVKKHMPIFQDAIWLSSRGAYLGSTTGSQVWDLDFMAYAVLDSGIALDEENREGVCKMLNYFDIQQIQGHTKHHGKDYRQDTKGGWTFTVSRNNYVVTDCTGETLKVVISLQSLPFTKRQISDSRLYDTCDLLLTMQNSTGAFGSYERRRAPHLTQLLNVSEICDIPMIELDYPECTGSVMVGLAKFHEEYPNYRPLEIQKCLRDAEKYLLKSQGKDGSWLGSWAICFTYATLFAIEGLSTVGHTWENSQPLRKACEFIASKQRPDGGWSEQASNCVDGIYKEHDYTQTAQTAWGVLALTKAKSPNHEAIKRGCKCLMAKQRSDGSWPLETGQFLFAGSIPARYPLYLYSWPIRALGCAYKHLGPDIWDS